MKNKLKKVNVLKPTFKIAVLMTTYNRVTNTKNCLENLFKCFLPKDFSLNVFIADSNSPDNTEKIIKKIFPEVDIFNVGDNIFWNQGMIKAWKRSIKINPDFFLWLNDDTVLHENSIKNILNDYSIKNNSIIVGVTKDEKGLTYGGRRDFKDYILSPNGTPQEIKIMNGNFVLVPKQVFEIIGNLNNKFSHSLGDIDYGLNALKNGIYIYCTSKIVGHCSKNESVWYKENSFIKRLKVLNSPKGTPLKEYFYFNKKHFGVIKAIKFLIASFVALIFPNLYGSLK
jgi:GT2 family glycosyltransferase